MCPQLAWISLLVYEWPHKIWYMTGSIFHNFPKFEPKLAQISENPGVWWFCSKFGAKLVSWYTSGTFSWKIGICMQVYFQTMQCERHIPNKTKLEYPPPPGIWKWRTSAYRRMKVGGIRCRVSSKKGGHSVWAPKKKKGVFLDSQKWESFSVQNWNFKPKFANFMLKLLIVAKTVKFLKMRAKLAKICNLYVKFVIKVEKTGSLGVDWGKKGGHWV